MSELTYLALGDSYTIGEGIDPGQSFPYQLCSLLLQNDIQVTSPHIVAKTGWTSGELISAIREQPELNTTWHMVTLLTGVNNQYRKYSPASYRLEFRELLRMSLALTGGKKEHIAVLSIPDWGVTPFAEGRDREEIAIEIADFNRINKEEANTAGTAYFDITAISGSAANSGSLLAKDGLHPSARMYRQWAELLLPFALKLFGKK